MRFSTPISALVGAAAGLVVAATGYQLAAAPVAPAPRSSDALAAVGRPLPAAPAQLRTRFAPCTPPATLHRGVCVTHQWRTTVVYDEPAAPVSAPPSPTQGAAGPVRTVVAAAQHAGEDEREGREVDHEADDRGEHRERGDD